MVAYLATLSSKVHMTARTFWQARAPRERQFLGVAVAVVCVGVVYAGVYEPAASGIAKLSLSLPQTQQQASQAEQFSAQISTQAAGSVKADYSSKMGIDAGLQAAGMGAEQASSSAAAPYLVTITGASGDALWAWLRGAPVSHGSFKRSVGGAWAGTATVTP